jgi:hypothetical protein
MDNYCQDDSSHHKKELADKYTCHVVVWGNDSPDGEERNHIDQRLMKTMNHYDTRNRFQLI